MNGKAWCCITCRRANPVVCRHDSCSKTIRFNSHMCGSEASKRECYARGAPLPMTLVWFTKLDTNSGFWQVSLAKESRLLTTFITPYGRFCFNKLPFGITSAPEHFQHHMNEILRDLLGVVCHVHDILVTGTGKKEHDSHLHAVLEKLEAADVTLSKEKCQFSCNKIVFLLMPIGFHLTLPKQKSFKR